MALYGWAVDHEAELAASKRGDPGYEQRVGRPIFGVATAPVA